MLKGQEIHSRKQLSFDICDERTTTLSFNDALMNTVKIHLGRSIHVVVKAQQELNRCAIHFGFRGEQAICGA